MDVFPAEVLDRIFIQLHLEQKLECMRVCHKWEQVIRTLDLLHTVILPSSDFYSNSGHHRFCSLVSAIQQNPSYAIQVERLILDRSPNEKFDAKLLPTLFPRLRFLCLNQARMPPVLDLRNGEFGSWQQQLETVVDISSTLFVPCMLTTGIFRRLTSISLFQYYGSHFLELNVIINGLKNAPGLAKLRLGHFYYYFHHFDMIHQAAPLLKSLSVSGVLLNNESVFQIFNNTNNTSTNHNRNYDNYESFLSQVEQNHYLETLCIEGDAYLLEQYVWIKYLSRKYTSLLHFTFNCNIPSHQQGEVIRQAHQEAYFEYIMPLFARLGPQLKSFQFSNHRLAPDLYQLFDDGGFQLENLQLEIGTSQSLIQGLTLSHQAKYLQRLSLHLGMGVDKLQPLKTLDSLKTLELKFRENEQSNVDQSKEKVALNLFLKLKCPDRLESLSLQNVVLSIEENEKKVNCDLVHHHQLKTFQITACKIDRVVFSYISQSCPNLHSLSLVHCLPERLLIDLSSHDMFYINIETKERGIFKINTTNTSAVYKRSCQQLNFISHLQDCFGKQDWPVYAIRKKDENIFKSLIDIHLTCKSIRTLFLNKRLAL